ncbi:unnamed protein product [Zymoseptoria tritici ST99CH_1A5]|uniref:Uncharacterized protein n=3 Tax=Zymoseptoria tritici TaxID=1047171 RepID=A0A1X7RGM4_ZYMT9|nr:unnamed protein product [Zymoseptoria tritici ST99CH_3D7]SMR42914.1 unnamed protein product [Zymoseptoria tritici ST99CH_1E4]SMR45084.1 unnamed protein product [Zymoseptoria tritici ST99CH_3D1]SMY20249.1 unnamed protein product [Zymoseptoria tritici ST99CH_1A5]
MKFQILALAALGGLITPAFAVGVVPDSTCTSADTKPDCEYNGGHVMLCKQADTQDPNCPWTWQKDVNCPPQNKHCVEGTCVAN